MIITPPPQMADFNQSWRKWLYDIYKKVSRKTSTAINVLDYGAVGDGVTDDSAAFALAYADLPTAGGEIYIPAGEYKISSALDFTSRTSMNFGMRGDGKHSTTLKINFATGNAISVNSAGFSMSDIGFYGSVNRNAGTYVLHCTGQFSASVHNTYYNMGRGGLLMFESLSWLSLSDNIGQSLTSTGGDTCLRIKGVAVTVASNNNFRTGPATGTAFGNAPCLWIGGATTTSMKFSNNGFMGGGPRYSIAVRGITSTASSFTVIVDGNIPTEFYAGDYIVLRGMTPSAYNNIFRIASVDSSGTYTSIVVTSTLNPGSSTVNGTAETVTTCAYVENSVGSVNESQFTGCLFEGLSYVTYGSAGLYFDGRRGTANLNGWLLNGNYYDFGAMGLLIHGGDDGTGGPTAWGISLNGGTFESTTRGIHLDQAVGITITGVNVNGFETTTTGDGLSFAADRSAAVAIFAGTTGTIRSRGITITNSNLGMCRQWDDDEQLNKAYDRALIIDGADVQDIVVTGNNIYGRGTGALMYENGALADSSRWKIHNNIIANGAMPYTAAMVIPTIASATSLGLGRGYDAMIVSGTTNISTITGGTVGREVTLMFSSANAFLTGGNLAISATYNVLAGQCVKAIFDGTSWYLK